MELIHSPSCNSLNLMGMWNEIKQLSSFTSSSKQNFIEKFCEIKAQLEHLPNASNLTKRVISTAFDKAISDGSDWDDLLRIIQVCTQELLLRGISNDLNFHQLPLNSLIDLIMESDYFADDIIEKFKNHPGIKEITHENFDQQLIRELDQDHDKYPMYWRIFASNKYFDSPEIKNSSKDAKILSLIYWNRN